MSSLNLRLAAIVSVILLAIALVIILACASSGPGRLTSKTSTPQPVDPVTDNAPVTRQLAPTLVLTLTIDGNTIALDDAHISNVPARAPRRPSGDTVRVTGLRGNQEAVRVEVPDEQLNVQEHGGIVRLTRRTVVAGLPLSSRIDEVRVEAPSATTAVFNVAALFERYCGQNRDAKYCH